MRNDLTIYDDHGGDWWDAGSRWFKSLHALNEFRVALLRRWLGADWSGRTVVDLGCGGGLLAEPLASAGARVLGVELSRASVAAARAHADSSSSSRILYVRGDLARAPLRDGRAEVVLLADVIEHVRDWRGALREAARLLAPGGRLYVNTLNRTWRARLLAITLAEGLGLVPRGTHDWRLFVRPDELIAAAAACDLQLVQLEGERPCIVATVRTGAIRLAAARRTSVRYSALFVRG